MDADDYQLIDQYFSKTLEETGQQRFQQKLETDTEFATAFELRKEMESFLEKRPQRESLKGQLKIMADAFDTEKKEVTAKVIPLAQNRKQWYWVGGIAAAVALIALVAWPFLFPSSLYEQYNQHRPLALQERGAATNIEAETAFNQQNYQLAYQNLNNYLSSQPDDVRAQLALGICALELDRFQEAADIFESIQTGTSALAQSATWYRALTYVKQEKIAEAKPYLEQIPEGSFWYTKAQELLEKLD